MTLSFVKMNGAGNDFVMVDGRGLDVEWSKELVARLCDRHRGIGADGLLVALAPQGGDADFAMRYFNSDGGEAEMCGNGARCFARFGARLLGAAGGVVRFETRAGLVSASLLEGGRVELAMTRPRDVGGEEALEVGVGGGAEEGLRVWSLNTGVPHAVIFLDSAEALEAADVDALGRAVRWHERFAPAGTNVNFAAVLGQGRLRVRTYERGVEGETLACGTGVVASALAHHLRTGCGSPIEVETRGGDVLGVRFVREGAGFGEVSLSGPAEFVFEGRIELGGLAGFEGAGASGGASGGGSGGASGGAGGGAGPDAGAGEGGGCCGR